MGGDAETTFQEIKDRVKAFAEERDWLQFHSPKNLSMALAAEAAELMEPMLWTEPADSHERVQEPARGQAIADELADILIYALEFANVTGIDVCDAIAAKMARNAQKYPVDKARGSSAKYTEL
ncbi:MAG: MazG-like family protein [Opitutales bacterium]